MDLESEGAEVILQLFLLGIYFIARLFTRQNNRISYLHLTLALRYYTQILSISLDADQVFDQLSDKRLNRQMNQTLTFVNAINSLFSLLCFLVEISVRLHAEFDFASQCLLVQEYLFWIHQDHRHWWCTILLMPNHLPRIQRLAGMAFAVLVLLSLPLFGLLVAPVHSLAVVQIGRHVVVHVWIKVLLFYLDLSLSSTSLLLATSLCILISILSSFLNPQLLLALRIVSLKLAPFLLV